MKPYIGNFLPSKIIGFVLIAILITGAGYCWQSVTKEQAVFQAALDTTAENTEDGNQPQKYMVVDIAEQGFLKNVFQPTKVRFSAGQGGIVNQGKEPLWLQIKANGFDGRVSLHSTTGQFDENTGRFMEALFPLQTYPLTVTIEFPKEHLEQYKICSGTIDILNVKDNLPIKTIPVQVVNSKFKKPDDKPADSEVYEVKAFSE